MKPITPCLWFDDQAEEAARFYTSIFKDSRIGKITRYGEAGREFHGKPPGSVMTVEFVINGQSFQALNGGPMFRFNEAISLQVYCETQTELDDYWDKLTSEGEESQCGWLKDRFGLCWQIIPSVLKELLSGPDPRQSGNVMNALLRMKKLDIAALKRAHEQ